MRYGICLSSVGEYSNPTLLAELAQEAEEVGWDGVFIWGPHRSTE
jgi:alkanesulfonate monooxygenase SsuD/methylene tetrahydromethanopterin reductase-like flavin-dependent oxidoreductase (luciferase family)